MPEKLAHLSPCIVGTKPFSLHQAKRLGVVTIHAGFQALDADAFAGVCGDSNDRGAEIGSVVSLHKAYPAVGMV